MQAVWGLSNNGEPNRSNKSSEGGLFQEQERLAFSQPYRRSSNILLEDCSYGEIHVPANISRSSIEFEESTFDAVHNDRSIEGQVSTAQQKIVVNVRGRLYETFTETLGRFPNTLLGSPEARQLFYEMDKKQYCFGLRDLSCFDSILFYYQSNGILSRPADVDWQTFYNEIRFFQLGESVIQDFLKSEGLVITWNQETVTFPGKRSWKLLEYPDSELLAKIFAMLSVLVICLSIIIFCGETLPSVRENAKTKLIFYLMEVFCIAWFMLEYILRLAFAPNRKQFCLSPMGCIDLLAIFPAFLTAITRRFNSSTSKQVPSHILRVLKLLRVLRMLKFSRYVHGMYTLGHTLMMSSEQLLLILSCLLISSVLFAGVAYFADSREDGSSIHSVIDGLWFAIVTLTTVGYGDIVPVSIVGKLNASVCMFVGYVVLSIPVPAIVQNFSTLYRMGKKS